jgi:hypothetical protein
MLDGHKHYFTSGTEGYGLLKADVDAHEDWQTDADETAEDVTDALGLANLFPVTSTRGWNLFLKVDYRGHTVREYNGLAERLGKVLKRLTAHRKCAVEVKGKARDGDTNGTLAKLPCYGPWDYLRLEEFIDTPVLTFDWLQTRVAQLETRLDQDRVPPAAPAPKGKVKVGSHTGTNVPMEALADQLTDLQPYRKLAYALMAYRVECRRKDLRLNYVDGMIFLALISLAKQYVRVAGQTPSKFIKLLWQRAHSDGIVSRAWNDSRYSVLWQTAADLELLDVESDHYYYHARGERKGQCMCWEAAERVCEVANGARKQNTDGQQRPQELITEGPLRHRPGIHRPTRVPAPWEDPWTTDKEARLEEILCVWT